MSQTRQTRPSSIVEPALRYLKLPVGLKLLVGQGADNTINQSVSKRDTARPPAFEITLEWLGLADASERRALAFPDQIIHAPQTVGRMALPIEIIFPRRIGENQSHSSINCRAAPLPASI